MRSGLRVLVVLAAFLGSSCDDETVPALSSAQGRIIGGTKDSGHPAVGAVIMSDGMCTGTLISPRLVVTAAHCAEGGSPDQFVMGSSMNGAGIPISKFVQHPDYESYHVESGQYVGWHDVAVAVLKQAATVTPMPYLTTSMTSLEGQPVTFVGFGATNGYSMSGEGTKYKVTLTIDDVWTQGFWNYVTGSTVKNTCVGDSGGPGLVTVNGVETIVGLVSSGDEYCQQDGYNTRVDTNADFLADMIATYDGGATSAVCGNGTCEVGESKSMCPADCGTTPSAVCGNGTCESGETKSTCPADCGTATTSDIWGSCGASDYSCPGDQFCVQWSDGSTHCTSDCASAADCPDGFDCYDLQDGGGACGPSSGTSTGTGTVWEACDPSDYSCAGDLFCVQWSDSSIHCTTDCSTASDCPSGFDCYDLEDGGGACGPAEAASPVCGDGACESGETAASCAADCATTPSPVCGDGACESGETVTSCAADCATTPSPVCGNGACESGETTASCPADCATTPSPVCGNGACEPAEKPATCPADCPVVCGDGACDAGETCDVCPADCGQCPVTTGPDAIDGTDVVVGDADVPVGVEGAPLLGGGCTASGRGASPLPLLALALLFVIPRRRRA